MYNLDFQHITETIVLKEVQSRFQYFMETYGMSKLFKSILYKYRFK